MPDEETESGDIAEMNCTLYFADDYQMVSPHSQKGGAMHLALAHSRAKVQRNREEEMHNGY